MMFPSMTSKARRQANADLNRNPSPCQKLFGDAEKGGFRDQEACFSGRWAASRCVSHPCIRRPVRTHGCSLSEPPTCPLLSKIPCRTVVLDLRMAVCLQVNQSGGRAQRGVGQNLHRKVGVQSTMPLARMMNRWFNQYSQKGAFAPPKLLAYSQKSQAGAIFPQLALSMLMFAAGSSRSCRRTSCSPLRSNTAWTH